MSKSTISKAIDLLKQAIGLLSGIQDVVSPSPPANSKLVVIDVGHSPTSEGATHALDKVGEHKWNSEMADLLATELEALGYNTAIMSRYPHNSISKECQEINELNAALAVSLHFNDSESNKASGTETLYCSGSSKSATCAKYVQEEMVEHLELPDRGIKAKVKGEDGYAFLAGVKPPAILVEPFFGDNPIDCNAVRAVGGKPALAKALAKGIHRFLA